MSKNNKISLSDNLSNESSDTGCSIKIRIQLSSWPFNETLEVESTDFLIGSVATNKFFSKGAKKCNYEVKINQDNVAVMMTSIVVRGQHSTEEAFALLTQPPRGLLLLDPKIYRAALLNQWTVAFNRIYLVLSK